MSCRAGLQRRKKVANKTDTGFAGWSATEHGRRHEANGGEKGKKRLYATFFNKAHEVRSADDRGKRREECCR